MPNSIATLRIRLARSLVTFCHEPVSPAATELAVMHLRRRETQSERWIDRLARVSSPAGDPSDCVIVVAGGTGSPGSRRGRDPLELPATLLGYVRMAPPAARATDMVLQSGPHCHAPMHPAAPSPTPAPHPPMPLQIIPPCCPTVLIGGQPAARATDQTQPCMIPVCVPGGPGMIAKGSATS